MIWLYLTAVALGIYTFCHDILPALRWEHRARQASRLKWDGFQPPFLMCWVYWIGVEKLFYRSKIHDEERMAAYLRYEFD